MNHLENLTAMAIFAMIVETGSFTETAQRLRLSKASVSRAIAQLETRLGTALLQRTTRKVTISELGLSYYHYCQRIMAEAKQADQFIHHFHAEPQGSLHLIAPVTFGFHCVTPSLAALLKQNIHLQIDLDLTDRQIKLDQDHYDIAIVISREKPAYPLVSQLIDITWGLYAAPRYLAHLTKPITHPETLPNQHYLLFRGNAHTLSLPFYKDKRQLAIDVNCRFRTNNSLALRDAAIAGLGIAYLPDYIAQTCVTDGSLQRLLADWQMDILHAWLVVKSEKIFSSRIKQWVTDLQQQLSKQLHPPSNP